MREATRHHDLKKSNARRNALAELGNALRGLNRQMQERSATIPAATLGG